MPSAAVTTSVPNCSTPPLSGSFFMTCARWPALISSQSSSFAVGTNSRRLSTFLRVVLQQLADEVGDERRVVEATFDHRPEVAEANLRDDVEDRAVLEELGAEPRERAEQQRRLAVDDARVEVRHRHRRRADRGLRVDLRLVLRDERGVRGLEELPADREDAVARDLGDAGALQQLERPAAGADEDEARA